MPMKKNMNVPAISAMIPLQALRILSLPACDGLPYYACPIVIGEAHGTASCSDALHGTCPRHDDAQCARRGTSDTASRRTLAGLYRVRRPGGRARPVLPRLR